MVIERFHYVHTLPYLTLPYFTFANLNLGIAMFNWTWMAGNGVLVHVW